ncbi:hypothetical protein SAMN00808754_0192 [Thermanaeromonas toyohensis ToBE]|uniref:Uncharacterized protein n=1 Tax=Thermanaeromonas toyohensis ToBE TaxID=698762 RepID=A0A1W1V8G7_9FIRM|nr:hypothetical protein [Thermanaeromonas toyohensis]SMB89642.1 hypothetical protein SAMN00808754_0192 [Thermanaeromonas toyohensis ToBE]
MRYYKIDSNTWKGAPKEMCLPARRRKRYINEEGKSNLDADNIQVED